MNRTDKSARRLLGVAAMLAAIPMLWVGCRGPWEMRRDPRREPMDKVVVQSPGLQSWSLVEELDGYPIEAGRLRTTPLANGRIEVAAELRSHLPDDQRIQVQAAFFDDSAFPTGDESNWQPVVLRGHETIVYRAQSLRPAAHVVVRVRIAD